MPLPSQAFALHGGCHCGSIRYRISVPAIEERPLHPTYKPSDTGSQESKQPRFPMSVICHCNDCRNATGALLNYVFCCPAPYVEFSFLPHDSPPSKMAMEGQASKEKETWIPALSLFPFPGSIPSIPKNTTLLCYASSKDRTRSFCAQCGTNISYSVDKMPDFVKEKWPNMLDIWLGTFDREGLELGSGEGEGEAKGEWLRPERHLWWDKGVRWIGEVSRFGSGSVPRHPSYGVDVILED